MTFQTFTFAQLCVSPLNVRSNPADIADRHAQEASIRRIGLIDPLVVHPITPALRAQFPEFAEWKDSATHAVFAGGRRLRSIGRLIEAGHFPADWPIPCSLRDLDPETAAGLITEISLAENFIGRDLRDYEIHAAVRDAAARGVPVQELADHFDQTPDWVEKQLRLGRLHPPIFAAYADGALSYDQARAFAATEDHALQAAAWKHFAGKPDYDRRPAHIRAFYRIGDHELERLLSFVGRKAYHAAGGVFEADLFSDANTATSGPVRVLDEGLLRDLAETRLANERERIRAACANPSLRFAEGPPTYAGGTDWSLAIELPERKGRFVLPAGPGIDSASVIATLHMRQSGDLDLRWWWAGRKAKAAAARVAATGNGAGNTPAGLSTVGTGRKPASDYDFTLRDFNTGQAARAAVKADHGLTGDGLQVLRSLRRSLLRGVLLHTALEGGPDRPATLARDYLMFAQLRHELLGESAARLGARHLGSAWHGSEDSEPADVVAPHLHHSSAHQLFDALLAELRRQPFLTLPDPVDGFAAYLALDEDDKTFAATLLACLALERSANVPGWRIPLHDAVFAAAGSTAEGLRALWQPDPAFFGLFPKLKKLELVQGLADPDVIAAWAAQKDSTIAVACAEVTRPGTHSDPDRKAAAGAWLHPLLTFAAAAPLEPDPDLAPAEPGEEPGLAA